jgi:hypothetical protein
MLAGVAGFWLGIRPVVARLRASVSIHLLPPPPPSPHLPLTVPMYVVSSIVVTLCTCVDAVESLRFPDPTCPTPPHPTPPRALSCIDHGPSMPTHWMYGCVTTPPSPIPPVVVLGCPASASPPLWLQIRHVVAGRLVNGYCSTDYMLRFVYRTQSLDWHVAGVGPVGVTGAWIRCGFDGVGLLHSRVFCHPVSCCLPPSPPPPPHTHTHTESPSLPSLRRCGGVEGPCASSHAVPITSAWHKCCSWPIYCHAQGPCPIPGP